MGLKLAVLASGRGTNFEAIANACRDGRIPGGSVVGLFTHNPTAQALERAERLNIPTFVIADSKDRKAYEKNLAEAIEKLSPHYLCLAGYLRLLGSDFVKRFNGRILNVHPSLLPAFKGLHAQKQAIAHGVRWTGCTVHLVTEDLDAGPILDQSVLEVRAGETEQSLIERLLPLEHETYVRALAKLASENAGLQPKK